MSASPRETIGQLYRAFALLDLETVEQRVSPEIVIVQSELLPWGGTYHGVEGLRTFFGKLAAHIDSAVEISESIEAGDRVVVIGRTRGYVRSNEAGFDIRIAHVWEVRDGLAVRFEPYIEVAKMLAALRTA